MSMADRVLVTGAGGFLGSYVCRKLLESGYTPVAGIRHIDTWPELRRAVPGLVEHSLLGDLSGNRNLQCRLANVVAIVHLAGRAPSAFHRAFERSRDYIRANVDGTRSIAHAAVAAGVRRMIFVSTAKVHGELTSDRPFTEDAPASHRTPYASSKWKAEEILRGIAANTGLEVVIVRPPQVYGPGVRGNFLRLMNLVDRALPLPLPAKDNRRSLLGVENLADFLVRCVNHPRAAGLSFLVKDTGDISTRSLIERLAQLLARPARFLPVSDSLIRFVAKLAFEQEAAVSVLDSLVIDSSRAERLLNWAPPSTLDDGLAATALWFRETKRKGRARDR